MKSCTMFAVQANGRSISTVEALEPNQMVMQDAIKHHLGIKDRL